MPHPRNALTCIAALWTLAAAPLPAGEPLLVTATWTGGAGDHIVWADVLNWDVGMVPNNTPETVFDVIIPADVPRIVVQSDVTIQSLLLGERSILEPSTGSLTVLGAAIVKGIVDAEGAGRFIALSNDSRLIGPAGYLRTNSRRGAPATGGVAFGATSIHGTSGPADWRLFKPYSPGSAVRLPDLHTIDLRAPAPGTGFAHCLIEVSANTTLDCPALEVIHAPAPADGRLRFIVFGQSNPVLPRLHTVTGNMVWQIEGSLDLPSMKAWHDSDIDIGSGAVVTAPRLVTMRGSTITASDGSTFIAPTLLNYVAGTPASQWLFHAYQGGSRIIFPSMKTLDVSAAGGMRISTWGGSRVEMPALRRIIGPRYRGDAFTFTFQSDGYIDLGRLRESTGLIHYLLYDAAPDLGSLRVATGARFSVGRDLPLDTPNLHTIDGSTFHLDDGAIHRSVATSYSTAGLIRPPGVLELDLMYAGWGATLDLSSITHLDVRPGNGSRLQFSTRGGTIDLSTLQTLLAPGHDRSFSFIIESGHIVLGEITLPAGVAIVHHGGTVDVLGDLTIAPGAGFRTWSGTNPGNSFLTVAGDLRIQTQGVLGARDIAVAMTGPGPHALEVAARDIGAQTPSFRTPNYYLGALHVGTASDATVVRLVDEHDNQDVAGQEALYLWSPEVDTALRVLGGSTLITGDIGVYARIDGELAHLSSLFTGGLEKIPFDEGFIARHRATNCICDVDATPGVNAFDLVVFTNAWASGSLGADFTRDRSIDVHDLMEFLDCWHAEAHACGGD